MIEDLEPLDPELAVLVGHERARPGMPAAAGTRLLERLGAAIPGLAAPSLTAAVKPRLPFLRRRLPLALTTFALGGAVGAGLHARLAVPAVVEVSVPAPPVVTPPPVILPPVEVPLPAPKPHRAAATAAKPPAPEGRDEALGRERVLIEIARAAMSRNNATDCIEALRRHLAEFPSGQLVEERESLWVQALVASGQNADARVRAQRFRQRYPSSLLLPVVDAALQAIP